MINRKTILAIIPARGGSKGVLRKNIREVAGKPLIAWSIETAKQSKYIDRLILSSDDEEIIEIAKVWGCEVPFVRPVELAGDDVPGIEPVVHALNVLPKKYDYVVLIQPTSPLRTAQDIDGCIERCVYKLANACVSVTETEKSPYWTYVLDVEGCMQPLIDTGKLISQRQDLPNVYVLNGAVYVANSKWLLKTKTFITAETLAYPMDKLNSIDIDDELDLKLAEVLLLQGV